MSSLLINRILVQAVKYLSSQSRLNTLRIVCIPVGLASGLLVSAMAEGGKAATSICEFEVKDIDGNDVSLSKYKGFVTLIVNVASK